MLNIFCHAKSRFSLRVYEQLENRAMWHPSCKKLDASFRWHDKEKLGGGIDG